MQPNAATSVSAILHAMTRLLTSQLKGGIEGPYILQTREIWFIPLLNVDGYEFINQQYQKSQRLSPFSKNRRNEKLHLENCGNFGVGVNILHNFNIGWNLQDKTEPCYADFKGESPNSENETKALVSLVKDQNFKMVINLLGYVFLSEKWAN